MVTGRAAGLHQSAQKVDFEGGVNMGIGSFNLVSKDSVRFVRVPLLTAM